MEEVTFVIERRVGVISNYQTGWSKELNLVSWCGAVSKYDIRDWSYEHSHMSRGITLHREEAEKLYMLLKKEFES